MFCFGLFSRSFHDLHKKFDLFPNKLTDVYQTLKIISKQLSENTVKHQNESNFPAIVACSSVDKFVNLMNP